ncbi:hypothetical protein, partial [Megasphaera sp.]|uniref:hypothetical protein n=1 Tax=Megasphaera sp. TaxID=2023260 RepID=UPI003FF00883
LHPAAAPAQTPHYLYKTKKTPIVRTFFIFFCQKAAFSIYFLRHKSHIAFFCLLFSIQHRLILDKPFEIIKFLCILL